MITNSRNKQQTAVERANFIIEVLLAEISGRRHNRAATTEATAATAVRAERTTTAVHVVFLWITKHIEFTSTLFSKSDPLLKPSPDTL